MSETISPNRASLDRAATAMFRSRLTVIPLDEEIKAASKFTLVFLYNDSREAARQMEQMGAQKHYVDEHGRRVQFTTATTVPRADMEPIGVYMSEWLPEMTLTVIEPTTYKAYLARQRAAAGKTMSVVIDMPRDHGRIHRLSSASGSSSPAPT